jgi:hypothetical protein
VIARARGIADHVANRYGIANHQGLACGRLQGFRGPGHQDRFGISWQVVPAKLIDLMTDPDSTKVARVTEAFMQMKKPDIASLEQVAAR